MLRLVELENEPTSSESEDEISEDSEPMTESYLVQSINNLLGSEDIQKKIEDIKSLNVISSCGKAFTSLELFWHCSDCSLVGETSCYCQECFKPDLHVGHKYIFEIGVPGCCDCGDASCLMKESFCNAHRRNDSEISLDLLPGEIKENASIVIKEFMKTFHLVLTSIDPNHLSKEKLKRALRGFKFIRYLYELSPIFHNLIYQEMEEKYPTHETLHICSIPENEELDIEEYFNQEGIFHNCKCSLLDNCTKLLLNFLEDGFDPEFFAELIKGIPKLGNSFLKSFCSNYHYIHKNWAIRRFYNEKYNTILWQANSNEQNLLECISISNYRKIFLKTIDQEIQIFRSSGAKYNDLIIDFLFNDLQYLFGKTEKLSKYLFLKTDFFELFLESIRKLQYSQLFDGNFGVVRNQTRVGYHTLFNVNSNLFSILSEFFKLLCAKDIPEVIEKLAPTIVTLLKEDFKMRESLVPSQKYIFIPLYKIFAIIVNKYILSKTTIIKIAGVEKYLSSLKDSLMNLFQMDALALNEFILNILKTILTVFGFTFQIMSNKWKNNPELTDILKKDFQKEKFEEFLLTDYLLFELLFPLLQHHEIIKLIDESCNLNIFSLGLILQKKDADKNVLQSQVTMMTYLFASLQSDDFLPYYFNYFSQLKKIESNSCDDEEIKHYLIREVLRTLMKKKSVKIQCFQLDDYFEDPNFLSYLEQKEKSFFYDLFPKTKKTGGFKGNTLSIEALKQFNLFQSVDLFSFEICVSKLKELYKDPKWKNAILTLPILMNPPFNSKFGIFSQAMVVQYIECGLIDKFVEILICTNEFYKSEFTKISCAKVLLTAVCLFNKLPQNLKNKMQTLLKINFSKILQKLKLIENPIFKYSLQQLSNKLKSIIDPESKPSQNEILEFTQKMVQIKNKFLKKEKNKLQNNLNENFLFYEVKSSTPKQETCSFCKKPIYLENYKSKPFGVPCLLSLTNVKEHAKKQSLQKIIQEYHLKLKVEEMQLLIQKEIYSLLTSLSSCGHYIHYECFKKMKQAKALAKYIDCKSCERPANCLLSYIPEPLTLQQIQESSLLREMMENFFIEEFYFMEFKKKEKKKIKKKSFAELFNKLSVFLKLAKTIISNSIELENFIPFPYLLKDYLPTLRLVLINIISILNINELQWKQDLEKSLSIKSEEEKWKNSLLNNNHFNHSIDQFVNFYIRLILSGSFDRKQWKDLFSQESKVILQTFSIQSAYLQFWEGNFRNRIISRGIFTTDDILEVFQQFSSQIKKDVVHRIVYKLILLKDLFLKIGDEKALFLKMIYETHNPSQEFDSCLSELGLDLSLFEMNNWNLCREMINTSISEHFKKFKIEPPSIALNPSLALTFKVPKFNLIDLSKSYSDFFLKYYPRKCENCQNPISSYMKSICLLCGETICIECCSNESNCKIKLFNRRRVEYSFISMWER